MEMKAAGISIALIAVVFMAFVRAEDDCGKAKATECVESYLSTLLGDLNEDDTCEEMHKVTDCLSDVADECFGEDRDPSIEKALKDMHDQLHLTCGGVGIDVESLAVEKCVADNLEDVMECQANGMTQASTFLRLSPFIEKREDITANLRKCLTYGLIAHCVEERLTEKCGEHVTEKAVEQMMENMPANIAEACSTQEFVEFRSHYEEIDDEKK